MVLVEASQTPAVQQSSVHTRSRGRVDPRLFGAPDDTPDERRYRQMLTIRRFEERLLALFEAGQLNGTTHACIGQEADAVGVIEHLGEGDHLFSNHRCHGHYLAWSGDVEGLLAEITGMPGGVCAGIGGSQHLCGPGFASNGILGGTLPAAAGIALAYKLDRTRPDRVGGLAPLSVVFCGDGALGEGIVYETLNMASLWALPLLVVVENNRYAQSTPIATNLAGTIAGRFAAFGIPVRELASFDVTEISAAASAEVAAARAGGGPRRADHRDVPALPPLQERRRPAPRRGRPAVGLRAHRRPRPAGRRWRRGDQRRGGSWPRRGVRRGTRSCPVSIDLRDETARVRPQQVTEIGRALRRALAEDPRTVLLGEDLVDPYGGAFKVTRGLSTDYPDRVLSTPISEAGVTGVAAGLALAGYRPIVEIMFGDFVSLCFDQIANHIVKYQGMYADAVRCPVIVRTPSGGGRGYGPTHSQSLEKHFLGVPGLRVIAPSLHHDIGAIYGELLAGDQPALMIEHKLLYGRHVDPPDGGRVGDLVLTQNPTTPTGAIGMAAVGRQRCRVTVVAYGYTAAVVRDVVARLAVERELFVELIVPAQLAPADLDAVIASAAVTGAVLTVEEGTAGWSWGDGVAAAVSTARFGQLRHPVRVLTSAAAVIPTARHLESDVLVSASAVEAALVELSK